ncbi:MAG: hypothetical protein AAFZ52_12800 [Bacteroidota bacterium]
MKMTQPSPWKCKSGLVLLFFCVWTTFLPAERITRTLVGEVTVGSETKITSQGPRPVRVDGRGAIDVRNEGNAYVVSGWRPLPHLFVLDQRAEFRSWDQTRVRQEVYLTLETDTPAQADSLLGALRIGLVVSPTNRLRLDYDLNIATVNVHNQWFTQKANYLVLDDGRRFPIRYFALRTVVYLPAGNPLELELDHCALVLEDRTGPTRITQRHGSLRGGCFNSLEAELRGVVADVDSLTTGDLTLEDTALRLGASSTLHLRAALAKIDLGSVTNLTVTRSLNDEIRINSLARAELTEVLFGSFVCGRLTEELTLTARNTDVRVNELSATIKRVRMDNRTADIHLGVGRLSVYRLARDPSGKNTYHLPSSPPIKAAGPLLRLLGTHCRYRLTIP